ncbi:MAG: peptide MFS transporter [Rikenellaceae bacterium]
MTPTKGHPKGLYLLFVTEMWERFSYYGMRALFVLYMTQALLFDKELASQIYGNYTGLVFLTPLVGGYIADRYWGNRRSILWGGVIMALGQLIMFLSACYFDLPTLSKPLLFVALAVLIIGNGLFKPNISTMVGDLYEPGDSRKDAAFTIFYMGINAGAMIAPIWCGFVGDTGNPAEFKWGFLSACIGMLIGTGAFQLLKDRYIVDHNGAAVGMPPARLAEEQRASKGSSSRPVEWRAIAVAATSLITLAALFIGVWGADIIGGIIYSSSIVMPIFILADRSLSRVERSRIGVIYIIAFFVIFFWAAFEQAGASLTFFANEQTDRNLFGWEMPASYFQMFNALFIVLLAPIFATVWSMLGSVGREPSSPVKQSMGLFLLSVGYLIIALGVRGVDGDTKVSMMWLVSLYLIHTMGEICLSPIGLSMVNKLSPARFSSLLMGVWFLSLSAANKFSGVLSGYYPDGGVAKSFLGYEIATLSQFFMLFVVMSGVAAVILFALSSLLKRMMEGVE